MEEEDSSFCSCEKGKSMKMAKLGNDGSGKNNQLGASLARGCSDIMPVARGNALKPSKMPPPLPPKKQKAFTEYLFGFVIC